MRKKILFLIIIFNVFNSFVIKNSLATSFIGLITKNLIGLNIRAKEIDINFSRIKVKEVSIKDRNGKMLSFVKSAEIGLNLYEKTKISYINIDDADTFLEIDIRKNYVNWSYPFFQGFDYVEDKKFKLKLPDFLGDINIKNSSLHFIDRSYGKDIHKTVTTASAKIVFDAENKKITITAEAKDNLEEYICKTTIVQDEVIVKLNLKNISVDDNISPYMRTKNLLNIKSGIVDLSLEIINSHPTGKIECKDGIMFSTLFKDYELPASGVINITPDRVTGQITSSIEKKQIDLSLNIDIKNKKLDVHAKLDNAPIGLILSKLVPLNFLYFDVTGSSNSKLDIAADLSSKNSSFNISIAEGSVFFNEYLESSDIKFDINSNNKLDNLTIIAKFKEGFLDLTFKNNLLSIDAVANSDFIKMIGINFIPTFRSKMKLEVKGGTDFKILTGTAKLEPIDLFLGEDFLYVNFSRRERYFNINVFNKKFHFHFFDSQLSYNTHLNFRENCKFKYKDIEGDFSGKCISSGSYKKDLFIKNGTIDIVCDKMIIAGYSIKKFDFKTSIDNNKIDLYPFSLVTIEDEIAIKNIRAEGMIDRAERSGLIYLYANNITLHQGAVVQDFLDAKISCTINKFGMNVKKFTTDKFRVEGVIPFYEESIDLTILSDHLNFNQYINVKNINIKIKDRSISFIDGNLELSNFSFPIRGNILYDKTKFYFENFALGKNNIRGTVGNEINISLNIAIDDAINQWMFNNINLVGQFIIFGTVSDPCAKGDIFLTSPYFPKLNFGISYNDLKVSLSNLTIYTNKKAISPMLDSIIDFKEDIAKLFINGKNMDLQDIFPFSSNCNLQIECDSKIRDIKYNILLELNNFVSEFLLIDNFQFKAHGDLRSFFIDHLSIKRFKDLISASGELDYTENSYNIAVNSKGIRLENFLNQNDYFNTIFGHLEFNLDLKNHNLKGDAVFKDVKSDIRLKKYIKELDSNFVFDNFNGFINLNNDDINLHFYSKLNNGVIGGDATYNTQQQNLFANIETNKVLISLLGYFNANINSKWKINNYEINGDITITSGDIVDIPDKNSFYNSSLDQEGTKFKLKQLNVKLDNNLRLKLNTFLNLEKIDVDLKGIINIKEQNNLYIINGYIISESGNIEFNKYNFALKEMKISFDPLKSYPDLFLMASSQVLGRNILLKLNGNLGNKNIKLTNDFKSQDNEDIFIVSLWSNDYDEYNNKLELEDILYLLSVGDSNSNFLSKSGNILTQELSKSLIFNPLSRKLKNFLGLYQFKISSPLFNLDNLTESKNWNPLSSMKVEISTNIYKNLIFFGIDGAMTYEGTNIQNIDCNFFTLNRWRLYFSFVSPFDNILFEGFGISKKFNYGRQEFEIGVSSIESIFTNVNFLSALSSIKVNFEMNLRF